MVTEQGGGCEWNIAVAVYSSNTSRLCCRNLLRALSNPRRRTATKRSPSSASWTPWWCPSIWISRHLRGMMTWRLVTRGLWASLRLGPTSPPVAVAVVPDPARQCHPHPTTPHLVGQRGCLHQPFPAVLCRLFIGPLLCLLVISIKTSSHSNTNSDLTITAAWHKHWQSYQHTALLPVPGELLPESQHPTCTLSRGAFSVPGW